MSDRLSPRVLDRVRANARHPGAVAPPRAALGWSDMYSTEAAWALMNSFATSKYQTGYMQELNAMFQKAAEEGKVSHDDQLAVMAGSMVLEDWVEANMPDEYKKALLGHQEQVKAVSEQLDMRSAEVFNRSGVVGDVGAFGAAMAGAMADPVNALMTLTPAAPFRMARSAASAARLRTGINPLSAARAGAPRHGAALMRPKPSFGEKARLAARQGAFDAAAITPPVLVAAGLDYMSHRQMGIDPELAVAGSMHRLFDIPATFLLRGASSLLIDQLFAKAAAGRAFLDGREVHPSAFESARFQAMHEHSVSSPHAQAWSRWLGVGKEFDLPQGVRIGSQEGAGLLFGSEAPTVPGEFPYTQVGTQGTFPKQGRHVRDVSTDLQARQGGLAQPAGRSAWAEGQRRYHDLEVPARLPEEVAAMSRSQLLADYGWAAAAPEAMEGPELMAMANDMEAAKGRQQADQEAGRPERERVAQMYPGFRLEGGAQQGSLPFGREVPSGRPEPRDYRPQAQLTPRERFMSGLAALPRPAQERLVSALQQLERRAEGEGAEAPQLVPPPAAPSFRLELSGRQDELFAPDDLTGGERAAFAEKAHCLS